MSNTKAIFHESAFVSVDCKMRIMLFISDLQYNHIFHGMFAPKLAFSYDETHYTLRSNAQPSLPFHIEPSQAAPPRGAFNVLSILPIQEMSLRDLTAEGEGLLLL